MDDKKKWLLMTYYCPTYGDSVILKPIELKKKRNEKKTLKKTKATKN